MIKRIIDRLIERALARGPDFVIGGPDNPYLRRWFLIPRNRFFNIYLHQFLRDDDDRALHDHPWPWCSILLRGGYIEHTIAAGGVHHTQERQAPSIKFAGPRRAHRIELLKVPAFLAPQPGTRTALTCWTVFITGPRIRQWGFHCPKGWVHWEKFTAPGDSSLIGKGCDQ